MKTLARKRRADRATALRTLGFDPDVPSVFASQTRGLLSEAEALRLPPSLESGGVVIFESVAPRPFVLGMDPLGGPNPL